jgi:hypothetical protein
LWAFIDLAGVYFGADDLDVALGTVGLGIACWVFLFPSVFALISTLASTAFMQTTRGKVPTVLICAMVGGICNVCIIVSGGASFLALAMLGSIIGPIVYLALTSIACVITFASGSRRHATPKPFNKASSSLNLSGQSCESLEIKDDAPLQPNIAANLDDVEAKKAVDDSGGVLELPAPAEKFPAPLGASQKIVGVGLQKVVVEWC